MLIYFNRALQDRALGLFHESLCHRGFLGLGSKESSTSRPTPTASSRWRRASASTASKARMKPLPRLRTADAVVIGASAGGVDALLALLRACRRLRAVVVVLHLPETARAGWPRCSPAA